MTLGSVHDEWCVADDWLGRGDGWYIVRLDDGYAGSFREGEAMMLLPEFKRRYSEEEPRA